MAVPDNGGLEIWDALVIIGYFIFVMAVGLWASFQSSRGTLKGYFLAGKSMIWLPIGASLFSSNIGSGHFIGLAGTGAASGLAVGSFEFNAMIILLLLGWVFVPIYMSAGVYTMPEYLQQRFGGQRMRVYLACLALLLSVLTKVSVDMYAGALFIQLSLGWNLYVAIVALLGITAVYTVAGGLAAVIYTDTLQTVIMLIGAFILMILGFQEVPYSELPVRYFQAVSNGTLERTMADPSYECGYPRSDAFNIFRDPTNSDLPWPGMIFGISISSIWYWCTDQVIVQRALAAKSLAHAKGGCVFAAVLKVLPMFIIVFPGMISRVLFPDDVGCSSPEACMDICGSETGCTNVAFPYLVLEIMPVGLRGLMLAVMLAALMSSLTSIFNSSSTIFTIDIYPRLRKNPTETELMVVGRLFVLVMVAISILWIPIIQAAQGGRLFDYIQSITSYLAPPICAVFLLAVLDTRTNEKGAFAGLMVGLLVGGIRMILDFIFPPPYCGFEDTRSEGIVKVLSMHYLYFGIMLFGLTLIVIPIVSRVTAPLPDKYIIRLTWFTRNIKREQKDDWSLSEVEEETEKNKLKDQTQTEEKHVSRGRKVVDWFCGTGEQKAPEMSKREKYEMLLMMTDIKESKTEKLILNISAVGVMCISVFFYAFYG